MSVSSTSSKITASVADDQIAAAITSSTISVSQPASYEDELSAQQQQTSPVQSVNGQIGNITIPLPSVVSQSPLGYATMYSTFAGGTLQFTARSSTGYFAVLWWDGTVGIYGTGSSSIYYSAGKTVNVSGNWSRSSPKAVSVWSCTSGNATKSGFLTGLSCSGRLLSALSVAGCSSLTDLSCDTNAIESLDISGCVSLTRISCFSNRIKELRLAECPGLLELFCQSNLLAGIDVSQNTLLGTLQCNSNPIATLSLANNAELAGLYAFDCELSSLVLSANSKLKNVNVSGNNLTSIRAAGVSASGLLGFNVSNNLLPAAALNTLYDDLAAVQSGSLYVSGNPGVTSDSPSIAIAKGYTVYGT